ncbi:MAG: helix-turn-helix domain-containing protein [Caloramator sp.]|nr:helix-turn-helix domain-containing protein [Caloramator sp.]
MDVGANIKNLRNLKGLSRREVSEISGVSAIYLAEIEYGKKTPTIETLLKLSNAFNITVSELIGEIEPSLSPELKELLDHAKELTSEQLEAITNLIKTIK